MAIVQTSPETRQAVEKAVKRARGYAVIGRSLDGKRKTLKLRLNDVVFEVRAVDAAGKRLTPDEMRAAVKKAYDQAKKNRGDLFDTALVRRVRRKRFGQDGQE